MMALYRMANGVQHYAWGSRSEIPRLTDIPNPEGRPMAELWMGDHPRLPSRIFSGAKEILLGDFLQQYPDFTLGTRVAGRFENRLPYLFKLLSAEQGLSIQVHPSIPEAREGYDREENRGIPLDAPNRNYKDRNHKPEILVAVTPFWALSGFRAPDAIAEDFRCIAGGESLVRALEAEGLEAFYRRLMAPEDDASPEGASPNDVSPNETPTRRLLEAGIHCALERLQGGASAADLSSAGAGARGHSRDNRAPGAYPSAAPPDPGPDSRFAWVVELSRQFPGDIGALAPLYLNCLFLDPGQAIFLESGLLHAYLHGTGIELMANSDNVLRGGCTAKHVDVRELLRIVRFEATENPRFVGNSRQLGDARITRFDPPVEEFELTRIEIEGSHVFEKGATPAILFVLEGTVTCIADAVQPEPGGPDFFPGEETAKLAGGASLFIPSAVERLRLEGTGEIYVAAV